MRLNKVLQRPIITEKSLERQGEGLYQFKVSVKASKNAIKDAVHSLFGVDVVSVKTMIMPGKKRRVRRTQRFIKTPKWKKAIVQLKDGQEIKLITQGK